MKTVIKYIFLNKKTDIDNIEELIKKHLIKKDYDVRDNYLITKDLNRIDILIECSNESKRYYFSASCELSNLKGVKELQTLDNAIINSDLKKDIDIIRLFDGASDNLCKKLYPYFAIFERKLRELILLVVSKAFGYQFINETIPSNLYNNLSAKQKGHINCNNVFELFDLSQLEDYLFENFPINYEEYLNVDLNINNLNSMSKIEIINKINSMRPKCLWEKLFLDIGEPNEWKDRIKEIHDCRNIIAHNKYLSLETYRNTFKNVKLLSKDIEKAIVKTKQKELSPKSSVEVLSGLASYINNIYANNFNDYDFSAFTKSLSERINNIFQENKEYFSIIEKSRMQFSEELNDLSNKFSVKVTLNRLSKIDKGYIMPIDGDGFI